MAKATQSRFSKLFNNYIDQRQRRAQMIVENMEAAKSGRKSKNGTVNSTSFYWL